MRLQLAALAAAGALAALGALGAGARADDRAEIDHRARVSGMCSCGAFGPTRTRRYGLDWKPSRIWPNSATWRFIVGEMFWVSVACAVSIERSRHSVTPGRSLPKMPPDLSHGSAPVSALASSGEAMPLSLSHTRSKLWL